MLVLIFFISSFRNHSGGPHARLEGIPVQCTARSPQLLAILTSTGPDIGRKWGYPTACPNLYELCTCNVRLTQMFIIVHSRIGVSNGRIQAGRMKSDHKRLNKKSGSSKRASNIHSASQILDTHPESHKTIYIVYTSTHSVTLTRYNKQIDRFWKRSI